MYIITARAIVCVLVDMLGSYIHKIVPFDHGEASNLPMSQLLPLPDLDLCLHARVHLDSFI